jgi:hypothetical protein
VLFLANVPRPLQRHSYRGTENIPLTKARSPNDRLGTLLDSRAVAGESIQNLTCGYLTAGVLIGLLAKHPVRLMVARSAIALVLAALAVWEGIETWRGEKHE